MENSRQTIQREIVLQAVLRLQGHGTADGIYEAIHDAHPLISKATVYRNLNVLERLGKIMRISVPNGADHFEAKTAAHYHIRCVGCGQVFDASLPYMPHLLSLEQKADQDFELMSCDILFTGLCPACKKQTQEKNHNKQGG